MVTRWSQGAPFDPTTLIDAALHESTEHLLTVLGYEDLTLATVARRAGLHLPTVQARYESKMALVFDTVFDTSTTPSRVLPDTGDFAADITRFVDLNVWRYTRPHVFNALPGLTADLDRTGEVGHRVRRRLQAGVLADFHDRVAAGVERGELRPRLSAPVLFDTTIALVMWHLFDNGTSPGATVREVTSLITRGVRG